MKTAHSAIIRLYPFSPGVGMNEFAQQPARKRAMSMKLSTAVTLMIGSVIGSVLILVYALWFMQISGATRDGVKDTALAVARTLADTREPGK